MEQFFRNMDVEKYDKQFKEEYDEDQYNKIKTPGLEKSYKEWKGKLKSVEKKE